MAYLDIKIVGAYMSLNVKMYRVRRKIMKQHNNFESMLAECQTFGETLEFRYSSLTKRYEPKALGGF